MRLRSYTLLRPPIPTVAEPGLGYAHLRGSAEQMAEVEARMFEMEGPLGRRGAIRLMAGAAALGVGSVALAACGASVPGATAVTGGATLNAANAQPSNPQSMVSVSGGTYTLVAQAGSVASGAKEDACTYFFSEATQDGTYTCQVKTQPAAASDTGWATAGLMARQSGDAGSPMVGVFATTGQGVQFMWRNTYQTAAAIWPMAIAIGVSAPIYVKLAKAGGNWTVSYSTDGKTYENATSMQVAFSGTSYLIGLAASSHSKAQALDVFTNLTGFKSAPSMYLDVNSSNTKANSSSSSA